MNKHKLNQDEVKEIAHFITQRSITSSRGEYIASLNEYLETYNLIIDKLEDYNNSID